MSDESAKYQAGNEQAEPAIEVERFERAGGHRWRIHSFYDGDSIALTEAGMRELLCGECVPRIVPIRTQCGRIERMVAFVAVLRINRLYRPIRTFSTFMDYYGLNQHE